MTELTPPSSTDITWTVISVRDPTRRVTRRARTAWLAYKAALLKDEEGIPLPYSGVWVRPAATSRESDAGSPDRKARRSRKRSKSSRRRKK